jgi:putative PIN family toxin of toxin-antitoxin system
MIGVVLDTNILVSALLSPFGNPAKIYKIFLTENLKIVYSSEILAEYNESYSDHACKSPLTRQ